MVKSLYTGVSGLKTHQQRMDVIGNNIANVNTVGYKTDVVTFADVYYQTKRSPSAPTSTLGGVNPRQVGYGVKVSSVAANMTQSGYTSSDKTTDLALDGEGFFQLMDGAGNLVYTRAGNFFIDDDGYLVNADGYHVLGVSGDSQSVAASSDIIRITAPATNANRSSATKMVNGTNVTLTVDAPSEYTNMTVSFQHAEYPYATFENNILTLFINTDQQYSSQEEFDQAIQKALQSGGVTLPDDVEISLTFDEIPNDYLAAAGSNDVQDIIFTTTTSAARYHYSETAAGKTMHAYIDFSVNENSTSDKVKLAYENTLTESATAVYNGGTWTITVRQDTTSADINQAIKNYLMNNPDLDVNELKCTAYTIPSGLDKATVLTAFATGNVPMDGDTPKNNAYVECNSTSSANGVLAADATTNPNGAYDPTASLLGVKQGNGITGAYDFNVQEEGEFSRNYQIVFAYKTGYGATSAVWDENKLTVNICPDSTIYDVNQAIKDAANGNDKKIIKFNNINGLAYGYGPNGKATTSVSSSVNATTGETEFVYTVVTEYNGGYYTKQTGATEDEAKNSTTVKWYDKNGREITDATEIAALPPAEKVGDTNIWNMNVRNEFFGGNPRVTPEGGKDSFFTKTAKSLSTFNLQDGRLGSPQPLKSITDLIIQNDGTIIGYHAVHGYMTLGRVDIALFDNPNGLAKCGGTNFKATVASGDPRVCIAGENGAGLVLSGALEMSNVDLADEFTNMISTQRGYQANSRVVTVSDTMLEELLNLKR